MPWRCPNSTLTDRRHLLTRVEGPMTSEEIPDASSNSFVGHDRDLAWAAYAAAHGIDAVSRREIFEELDEAVSLVDGVRFAPTPMARSEALSDELGFHADGGVWVKDETGAVAGSHKARHLVGVLLHLRAAEAIGHLPQRAPLAIASCGNAALAAATLARAAEWPLDVYVPTWMSEAVGTRLDELGARVHRCERQAADPPGDPSMFRFREAVEEGSIPFTVQGPENALCLDTGRTIGWEVAAQMAAAGGQPLDRAFAQVGGGAFASSLGSALLGSSDVPKLHAVQAEGCAPLARAWERAAGRSDLAAHWEELMTVWPDPHSVADGILDDETYDWLGVFDALTRSGGSPVVAPEDAILRAHRMAVAAGLDVSATGSAGLAGLLTIRDSIDDGERVLVVATGVSR
jgi:threonine dehydratase